MLLPYLPVHFELSFVSPVLADNPPLFVLRSLLGKELRSMSCIAHKSKCQECMYNKTCTYAFLFESILEQKNAIVPGRNRASHPFAFTQGKNATGKSLDKYDFTITLFGKAIDYLPYIYAAFVRAGKNGMFKERVQFAVHKVIADKKDILISAEQIDTNVSPRFFDFNSKSADSSEKIQKGEILVELKTPLRFKVAGKYSNNFSARDFMNCLYRRMNTLCSLYGEADSVPCATNLSNEPIQITEENFYWTQSCHYSARQKEAMELGGVTGTFKLTGTFTQSDIKLLEFARLANAGKNTNFGLGQIDFWGKWE